ncbi:MAG: Methyltransferase type 11 [Candidatus Amesbacteria bacterium GW2011_GWC2_47_8]|uniref:Methyltransferase type 11 n=1 Tax=Candidatus Amesbacteria bacterium GW2011_GWC2_47_8 TaxID=1618367 RepID=A0A0G1TPX2_9BACT|nr:MAG: Methyltransferase type 11 [Candidatus Amesbacteria bacterium GW2011_GWC2_47_8]
MIRSVIEDLGYPYSAKDKEFYIERYEKILGLLPKIRQGDVGLEVGLAGVILAITVRRMFGLKRLYALEHPAAVKQFSRRYLGSLKKEKIILSGVDLHRRRLPWKDRFFDFVICSEVIEHLIPADVPGFFSELRRVMKKGGWVVVTTPNIASLTKRLSLLVGKNPNEFDLRLHEGRTYGHVREYTMQEVEIVLTEAGFKVVKSIYFMIDTNRNWHLRIEALASRIFLSLANNLAIVVC